MKKSILLVGLVVALASCGANVTEEAVSADSTATVTVAVDSTCFVADSTIVDSVAAN